MTAAPESVTWLASRGRTRPNTGIRHLCRRWERLLVVLAVCLPVPVLAATGLSIPLPATVERLAAALVPWAGAVNLDAEESPAVGADGAIVLSRHELAGIQPGGLPTALAAATADRSRTPTNGETRSGKGDGSPGGGTANGGGTAGTSSDPPGGGSGGGGSSGSGGSGGGGSSGSSGPLQGIIEEAGSATQPILDPVQGAVDDPVGTVGGIVEDTGQAAGGVLPIAGP